MNRIKHLNVFCEDRQVGTLAKTSTGMVAFQYTDVWLREGYSISPVSIPLADKVFVPKSEPFDGLFGVFADSLPDGWGRLLVDRMLRENKIDPLSLDPLQRLAIVGESGMGALSYKPVYELKARNSMLDYDMLAEACANVLADKHSDDLDELFRLGGSSGGARPKVMTEINGEAWIVKFPSSSDKKDIGKEEFLYNQAADKCGITVAEHALLASKKCAGYFASKRFDRKRCTDNSNCRVHMISVSGLLETSHRIPNLDYNVLMRLTGYLTRSNEDLEQLYRLMCFNVFAHNRDDHSKNFSFLYDETIKEWHLAPAYDLTYSSSLGGEHATTVNGNGSNPGEKELLEVAKNASISQRVAKNIIEEVNITVHEELNGILG